MIGIISLAIGLLGQWLLGLFLALRILSFRNRAQPTTMELYGLGCALGVGATAWILFILSFSGVRLGFLPSCLLTVAGYLAGGPILLKRLRERKNEAGAQSTMSVKVQQETAACRACQSLIAFLFVICVLQTLQTPQKLWDERAIFALKARVLFEEGSIRSPALLHPDFVQYHPRYPLLLPLAEEHVYALLGHVDDRLSKLVFSLLYFGLVLTTAGVLLRHLTRGQAWLGAVLLATVPVLMPYEYGFLCGQADAPVACYHGLSALYLWDALQRHRTGGLCPTNGSEPSQNMIAKFCSGHNEGSDPSVGQSRVGETCHGSLVMAGICGGLTAFTKDEGIAYLMVDSSILGLFAICSVGNANRFRNMLQSGMLFVAAAAAILSTWFLHRRNLPLTTEMNYFGRMSFSLFVSHLDTLNWSIPHLARRMFWEWREWGLQWWFMLAAIISRPFRMLETPQLFLILDIMGSLASLLLAGILAPAQLDEHIGGSSHRFLMQLTPVAILLTLTTLLDQPKTLPSDAATLHIGPGCR